MKRIINKLPVNTVMTVSMECEATAIDPEDNNTHDILRDSQHNNDNTNDHNTPILEINLTMAKSSQDKPLQPRQHARDGHTSNTSTSNVEHLPQNTKTLTDHKDVANVGYPRLSNTHHINSPANHAPVAAVGLSQPDNTTTKVNASHPATHPYPCNTFCCKPY